MVNRNIIKFLSSLLLGIGLFSTCITVNASPYGWKKIADKWTYCNDFTYSIGWQYIDANWYWFNGDGIMLTGWIYEDTNWYYLYENGTMAYDTWIGPYYLNSKGSWIPNLKLTTAPDVIGLDKNIAKKKLEDANLNVFFTEKETSNALENDMVLYQSLKNSEIEPGTSITITVGKYIYNY